MNIGSKILLEGLENTRDLGGYVGANGKRIKPHKIIRSGALFAATKSDIDILTQEYNIKTDVDFRTMQETLEAPDPVIDGVKYISNPIIADMTIGITHEGENKTSKELTLSADKTIKKPKDKIDVLLSYLDLLGENPIERLAQTYLDIVNDEYSTEQYKKFLHIFLENKNGAVLFHCTSGKDRVGFGTALILSALGVDRKTILEDYLKTNDIMAEKAKKINAAALAKGVSKEKANSLILITNVNVVYLQSIFDLIEKKYGSMENYLEVKMELCSDDITKLRTMYLE